jgi:hypothetical protein
MSIPAAARMNSRAPPPASLMQAFLQAASLAMHKMNTRMQRQSAYVNISYKAKTLQSTRLHAIFARASLSQQALATAPDRVHEALRLLRLAEPSSKPHQHVFKHSWSSSASVLTLHNASGNEALSFSEASFAAVSAAAARCC